MGKNWDAYSDSDVSIRSIEDRRSVCSSTETDTDTGSPSPTPIPSVFYGKRRIKHFRTIAIIVRFENSFIHSFLFENKKKKI